MILSLIVLILAVMAGAFVTMNPMIVGMRTGSSHDEFEILKSDEHLDDELFHLARAIGSVDFPKYRNHCLRTLTFTKYLLSDEALKEMPRAMDLAAVALAYHDVGLWSDKALNYLEPSSAQMVKGALNDENFSSHDVEIMKAIIEEHHKFTDFESDRFNSTAIELINSVRKADWADFSMGVIRFGMPAALIEAAYDAIPEAGFHAMLFGMVGRLSPDDSIGGNLEIMKIFKW